MNVILPILNLGLFVLLVVMMIWIFVRVIRRSLKPVEKQRPHATFKDAGLRDLIREGRIDRAIKVYQEFTGVDMFTAQEAITDLMQTVKLDEMAPELKRLIRLGDKASAIETYQDATGATLADALAAIESLEINESIKQAKS